ncbi:unnamed protein product [Leuciscus chuanchicus]
MWRLYTIKNPKTYKYIPDLQSAILHSRLLATRGMTGKQPLALDDPRRLGLLSGGPAPTVQELKEKKERRGLVHDQLFNLRQANNSVSAYALQFHTLAATNGWNEAALLTAFCQGLNTDVRQLMVVHDDAIGIENFIQKAIRVSQCLTACSLQNAAAYPPPSAPSVALPAPEPMQVDSYHLTHVERQRRFQNQLFILWERRSCYHRLSCSTTTSRAQALIDSGSAGNFISVQLLQKLNVHKKRCSQDLRIHTTKLLGRGRIRHLCPTLTLRIGCLHSEKITFMVLEGSTADLILGHPWMTQHQPHFNWDTRELLEARQSVLAEDEVGIWKCATIDLMSDEEDGIVGGVSGWIVQPPSFRSQELTELCATLQSRLEATPKYRATHHRRFRSGSNLERAPLDTYSSEDENRRFMVL